MGIFSYNSNEEEFSDLLKSLRSLPKVKADDNFEYKLMVKIRNKDFSLNYDEKHFNYSRGVIPIAAFAFSVILVFFVISDSSVNLENPLLKEPPVRQASVSSQADTIEIVSTPASVNNNMTLSQSTNLLPEEDTDAEQVMKVVVEANDVVTTVEVENEPYPFDQSRSLDLDSYVTGGRTSDAGRRGVLVGGTPQQNSSFDGFLIREKPSQEVINSHKAIMDSLKKSREKQK